MPTPSKFKEDELIRDGLKFKAEINDPGSGLVSLLMAFHILRERYIQMAKNAHSRKNEERASYFMGIVDGIDQCRLYPQKMIDKWEKTMDEQIGVGN